MKRRVREEIEVTWVRKRRVKRERAIKPVITLLSKNEDWILKGTELITNTKKKRLKIYSRG